jgi:hypothetical protein
MKVRWTHAIWVTVYALTNCEDYPEYDEDVQILLTVEAAVDRPRLGELSDSDGLELIQWEINSSASGKLKHWRLPILPQDLVIWEAIENWWAESSVECWDSYEEI